MALQSTHETSVSLGGDLDVDKVGDIRRAFESLEGDHVVIDLHDARSVSSVFFQALLRLRRRLPESRIEVVGASEKVRRTFRVVGVQALVAVV